MGFFHDPNPSSVVRNDPVGQPNAGLPPQNKEYSTALMEDGVQNYQKQT